MSITSQIRAIASRLFDRRRLQHDLEEEHQAHIANRADDLERSGSSRAEAERRARVEFGSRTHYQQESQEALGATAIESFFFDLRYALRMIRKSPGFTVTAILTLALAIAANAIVFSFARGLILRPIDVPNPNNLYTIQLGKDHSPQQSYPDYLDLRDRNRTFDGMVAASIAPVGFDSDGKAITTWTNEVSGNYFDVLGVQPYLGRMLHASDEHGPNSSPYIVLSYGFWKSHFHADPAAVGRVVQVNKHPYTILGVAPEGFRGTEIFFNSEFWVPLVNQEQIEGYSQLKDRGSRGLWTVGRIKPGIQLAQATTDLASIAQYLAATYPKEDANAVFTMARSGLMGDFFGGPVRAFLAGLALLAALILLAACANLGSLFAARASDRSREIALRLALGSSRRRILRQLLAEAILISFAGGVTGIIASVVLLRMLSTLQPVPNFPINLPVNPDWQVYIAALVLALLSGLLFGLVPVRQVLNANPWQVVKAGASAAIGRRFSTRDILLVLQIVICGVLVTASLVAVRGLIRSLRANFGFDPQQTYLLNTDLDMAGYKDARAVEMQKRLIDTYEGLPGVRTVGLIDRPPLSLGWSNYSIFRDDATEFTLSHATTDALAYSISPEYLEAAGTRLVAGRAFTLHDDAQSPAVAIINRELARRIFGTEDRAVGGFLKLSADKRIQVVGIVEDGKYKTVTEDPQPAIFRPILQAPTTATWLVIRSSRDNTALAPLLDSTMRALDPELPFTLIPWTKQLDGALFPSRVATIALGSLGILGAMLAATGIFGMASYSVSRRLRELGIRIALGAQRRELLGAAIGRAIHLLVWGSLAGLLLGLASTRILAAIVYQASPSDPLVLASVIVSMLLLGLIATWIPARRALSIDPLMLLREE
ncbi:MAG TPA: ABC transporter permease [Acidobacteriaceae bacterium]|nr:ABC transporter permease [Acidobacteriaceae bacterium]